MSSEHWMFGMGWWWMWPIMIIFAVVFIYLVVWTYQDAEKQGKNAVLWTLLVFLTMGVGIIVYAVIRNSDSDVSRAKNVFGTKQEQHVIENSLFCEHCGDHLKPEDNFCSNCGNTVL
jgi:hypothetical protein